VFHLSSSTPSLIIIDNALEVGLLLAANEGDVDSAGAPHRKAADIGDAGREVDDVGERRRLEEKLRRLRESLEQRQAQVASA
jgi:hypothetical protein